MKIATFNVNSIKARLPNVLTWLKEFDPDVALFQELKCMDDAFPRLEIEDAGYNVETHGQKSYNGVAILSKYPLEDVQARLPGDENDEQARYLEATVDGKVRVSAIYLPNGNPIDTEKFPYKIKWMERLRARATELLRDYDIPVVLGGDYNVIEVDDDCYDAQRLAKDALMQPESRREFKALQHLGFTNAFKALNPGVHQYSYWDYQAGAWPKDNGLLIDHLLLNSYAADVLKASGIDKNPRGQEKASDHTPVWCELEL